MRISWIALVLAAMLSGCGEPSDLLDCSGSGSAKGRYDEANSGRIEFKHAVVYAQGDGHTVLFTDDDTLAAAMRKSPDPETEGALAASMFNRLLVGFRFGADGQLTEHLTLGSSTSSGTDGSDRGAIRFDDAGCVRGDVRRGRVGKGFFAVPLTRPERAEANPEVDLGPATNAAIPFEPPVENLARWREAHARLSGLHPVLAVQALGFGPGAATVLAADPRSRDVLNRVLQQCVDPEQASLNEYGEVVGPSPEHDGFVFQATVVTQSSNEGEFLHNCWVMHRNEEALEQCWPMRSDCRRVPAYDPG